MVSHDFSIPYQNMRIVYVPEKHAFAVKHQSANLTHGIIALNKVVTEDVIIALAEGIKAQRDGAEAPDMDAPEDKAADHADNGKDAIDSLDDVEKETPEPPKAEEKKTTRRTTKKTPATDA